MNAASTEGTTGVVGRNPLKEFKNVRVGLETYELLCKLQTRLAQRSYEAMPGEMTGKGRPTLGAVMTAALEAMSARMDAEDGIPEVAAAVLGKEIES